MTEKVVTKEIIDGMKKTIRNLYLADDIPWVIGYSGGKDSTATLQLVWIALEELPKMHCISLCISYIQILLLNHQWYLNGHIIL